MLEQTIPKISGFRFSAIGCGIKDPKSDRLDLALISADRPAVTAGLTTTNIVFAAPVAIARRCLEKGVCQALILNSGNANAVTGEEGLNNALDLIGETGKALAIDPDLIIPMSTGVIGQPMPVERIRARIPQLVEGLEPDKCMLVARAVMTTDTKPKTVLLEDKVDGLPLRMLGIAKGSGMIAPNMATLLAVVLVDMFVELPFLSECLREAADASFHCITIDGDTSTNDTVIAMAAGRQDAPVLPGSEPSKRAFAQALSRICLDLARQIVSDGEGVTKVVEVRVAGTSDKKGARKIARTIAESPLVKTAFYGEDPNWGRIIAAAGRAGVKFNLERADLFIGDVQVLRDGAPVSSDWEHRAHEDMKKREFSVVLDLKSGTEEATMLTTDLSEGYVRINAAYRT